MVKLKYCNIPNKWNQFSNLRVILLIEIESVTYFKRKTFIIYFKLKIKHFGAYIKYKNQI